MFTAPRKPQRVSVTLPATLTLETPHLREKTARIGLVARALAIFRVEEVIIYLDQESSRARQEAMLIEKILRFQETPQYLRKYLFKVDSDLAFAGTLPPLRTPHHPDKTSPKPGFIREGVVVSAGQTSMVEAGFDELVAVKERIGVGKRVTVRVTSPHPVLEAELVERDGLTIYWGSLVSRDERTLGQIINSGDRDLTISTSRRGIDLRDVMQQLQVRWKASHSPIILFGSPSEGVPEILARTGADKSNIDFNINTIPCQGVATVRTEEAIFGTLAVLSLLKEA